MESHQIHQKLPPSVSAVPALSPRKLESGLLTSTTPSHLAARLPRFNEFSVPTEAEIASSDLGLACPYTTVLESKLARACSCKWMHGHSQTASAAVVFLLSSFGSTRNRAALGMVFFSCLARFSTWNPCSIFTSSPNRESPSDSGRLFWPLYPGTCWNCNFISLPRIVSTVVRMIHHGDQHSTIATHLMFHASRKVWTRLEMRWK